MEYTITTHKIRNSKKKWLVLMLAFRRFVTVAKLLVNFPEPWFTSL